MSDTEHHFREYVQARCARMSTAELERVAAAPQDRHWRDEAVMELTKRQIEEMDGTDSGRVARPGDIYIWGLIALLLIAACWKG